MRYVRLVVCVVAVAGAGGLAACNWFSKPNAVLIADTNSPIKDVPVPAGFSRTKDSTSKVVPSSGMRIVDHHYSGSDDLLPVVRFYRDNMPANGWTALEQTEEPGNEITLHFTKPNEDCLVTVSKGAFSTHIRVKIDPKGGAAK